jgi:SAM-dependent methyltransferase
MNRAPGSEVAVTALPTPDFDGLARPYRWMELATFGPYLTRCRTAFLRDCLTCRRALILGDGDGRFTAELLRANPTIEIDVVDASAAMLRALLHRAGSDRGRVHSYCADVRGFQPPHPPYDLVVTHFFLDCLATGEIGALAATLRGATSDDALWVVSEFAVPPGWFGRLVARPLIWFLYRAFAVLTGLRIRKLPDHGAALASAGFSQKRRKLWLHNLLVSEIWTRESDAQGENSNVTNLLK